VRDPRTTFAAGAMLCDPEGRVLFLRRSTSSDHPGEWCLPAGGIDRGETAEEAMTREVYEEAGYDEPLQDVIEVDHKVSDEGVDFTTFAASVPSFTPQLNDEHTDYCWREPDNAPLPLHPGLLAMLRRVQLHDYDPSEERDDRGRWSEGLSDRPMPEKSVMMNFDPANLDNPVGPSASSGSVEVLINPSERSALSYAKDIARDNFDYKGKKSSFASLRKMVDSHGNVLAWDALKAIHLQVLGAAQKLGMRFPADMRESLARGEGGAWNVDNGRLQSSALAEISSGQKIARQAAPPVIAAVPPKFASRYAEPARPVFGKKKVVRDDYNPDEPRNAHGEWTSGGDVDSVDMANVEKLSGKMGSNEGGVYKDKTTGVQFYIKQLKSSDHAANEVIAAKLYQLAGVNTLNYVPVKGASGKAVATVMQPLVKNNVSQLSPVERKTAQSDFAVHAWLANWDAVGTGGDNIGVTQGGKVTVLDTGGSLKYRAQGELKGEAFGETVHEIESLRNSSTSPDAAALYGSMHNVEIAASIDRVKKIPDGDIVKTVIKNGGTMALANQLIARKDDLVSYANIITAKSKPNLAAEITKAPGLDLTPAAVPVTPVFKTKMEHAKHLLMKGTTADEMKKALGWPSIGVPKTASDLNLNLVKTKLPGGAFHYKGHPMTPEEVAAKGGKVVAIVPKGLEPAVVAPAPKAAEHDVDSPVGNFKQSLENAGVPYTTVVMGNTHTIMVESEHAGMAAQVAKWHPAVVPGSEDDEVGVYHVKEAAAAKPVVAVAPVPKFEPGIATPEELKKAEKNAKLLLQYVPGAPQNHPEAQKLVDLFNEKYEGKVVSKPEALKEKVDDFKKLQHSMIPLMTAQQQAETALQVEQKAKIAAKVAEAKAKEAAKWANMDPETKHHYEVLKAIGHAGNDSYMQQKIEEHGLNITPTQGQFIQAYVGSHYGPVNEQLRNGVLSMAQHQYASALNDALDKMPKYEGDVVRGASLTPSAFQKYKDAVGGVVIENQFTSAGVKAKLWGDNTFYIKSKSARDLRAFNPEEGGGEVVFKSGTKFHVTKVEGKDIYMEEL
jgi:8-oxo-dGTP pyrophosphatase MutT (NUDIX family)